MTFLLEEKKVEATVKKINKDALTVLDFFEVFKRAYPADWARLVRRFGNFGEKRRYTVTTYLSNRFDVYSQKPGSLLRPFTHYSKGKFKDYRKIAAWERPHFGSEWIAVFRKKT
jgi:hypothetical protein